MRLYLLPISTRRTLLYCQKLQPPSSASTPTPKQKQSWGDYIQTKAALTWASWEKKESGWQKAVASYGNQLLRKLPYEEWALKSMPPLTKSRQRQLEALLQQQAQAEGDFEMESGEKGGSKRGKVEVDKVEVVYPGGLIKAEQVPRILHKLATEREGHHKKWFWWCLAGMPVTIPIGILPLYVFFSYLPVSATSTNRFTITESPTSPSSTSATAPGPTIAPSPAANTFLSSSNTPPAS